MTPKQWERHKKLVAKRQFWPTCPEARKTLEENLRIKDIIEIVEDRAWLPEGVYSPVDGTLCKVYRTNITRTQARALVCLYHLGEWDEKTGKFSSDFIEVSMALPRSIVRTNGTVATPRHWGLTIARDRLETQEGQRTSGYWKLSQLGALFVREDIWVPKYKSLYKNRCLGTSYNKWTLISQCLLDKFHYEKFMDRSGYIWDDIEKEREKKSKEERKKGLTLVK